MSIINVLTQNNIVRVWVCDTQVRIITIYSFIYRSYVSVVGTYVLIIVDCYCVTYYGRLTRASEINNIREGFDWAI